MDLQPIRFRRAKRPHRPSPLKVEIANLAEKIRLGNDAIDRANAKFRPSNGYCCAGCACPGYYDLCDMVEDREKRRQQLLDKINFHTRKVPNEQSI